MRFYIRPPVIIIVRSQQGSNLLDINPILNFDIFHSLEFSNISGYENHIIYNYSGTYNLQY